MQRFDVDVLHPPRRGYIYTVKRNFSSFLEMALARRAPIPWVLDCDDGCAVKLAAELQALVGKKNLPVPLRFALMVREYETLFLAEQEAARSKLGLGTELNFPDDPESIRDAKGWLSKHLPPGKAYKPMTDQSALTATLDLSILRARFPSFRHFERALIALVDQA